MIRICQRRDAVCPHGIDCPYWKDGSDCPNEPKAKAALQPDADVARMVQEWRDDRWRIENSTWYSTQTMEYARAKRDTQFAFEAADLVTRLSAELAEAIAEREDFEFQLSDALCGEDAERTRATAAEARIAELEHELAEAKAEIERMTPKFVAYEYLESPAGREIAEVRATAAEAERDRLRTTLRPFAEALSRYTFAEHQLILLSEDNPKGRRLSHLRPENFEAARAALGEKADG